MSPPWRGRRLTARRAARAGGAEVIRRQTKGDTAGGGGGGGNGCGGSGPVDLGAIPRPQIVMINCSFDSVRGEGGREGRERYLALTHGLCH